jgi:D-beta-D-heptose 7-phosphate kinase/D-beta-D-heptose 1-phosphate adenosyltransferase
VLVVGDAMLDVYLRGAASRISPEAPVPVVRVSEEWRALGGAANVAANVVSLGAGCALIAIVGDDDAGRALSAELAAKGIDGSGVCVAASRPTTVKTRVLARHHQVARYDREADEDVGPGEAELLAEAVERAAERCDAIALEDYDKGVMVPAVIEAGLDGARRGGRTVVVDPKDRRFFDYRGATVFKPNRHELASALRAPVLAEDPEWLERTRRHLDCSNLLVTLGEEGMALASEDACTLVPATARSVYDVSGAGDTVTAAVAVFMAAGASPLEAAQLANAAAGVQVTKAGAATVSPAELTRAVAAAWDNPSRSEP